MNIGSPLHHLSKPTLSPSGDKEEGGNASTKQLTGATSTALGNVFHPDMKERITFSSIIAYIDYILEFIETVGEDVGSEEENSTLLKIIFLNEIVFKETVGNENFADQEVKFLWKQVNHVVQPLRNLLSIFDGINDVDENTRSTLFKETLPFTTEGIKRDKYTYIGKLKRYKELCNDGDNKLVLASEFESYFRKALPRGIKFNIDIQNGVRYGINIIPFQILLDNLVSNYEKYGKNGELFLLVENGKLQIIFINDIKTKAEQGDAHSSEIGNNLISEMLEELFDGSATVQNNKKEGKYKIEVKGVKLKELS